MKNSAFAILRVSMGINFLFHAINRFYYGVSGFKDWMVKEFEATFFPTQFTASFATVLPVLELVIGISLLLGVKTKWGLFLGSGVIISLIAGSCMTNHWDWVGLQMVYIICFYLMFENIDKNEYSVDAKFNLK